MTDPLMVVMPWTQPDNQDAVVCKAYGFAIVTWPSGRRTLTQYYTAAIVHPLELRRGVPSNLVMTQRETSMLRSAAAWRQTAHPRGWLIRERHGRRKARAVRGVAWIHPRSYRGPAPGPGDVIA